MSTYILIPGAWHGSWCWSEVVPLLEGAGHRVLTPDLLGMEPGQGAMPNNPIAAWADQIARIVRAQSDRVILVGHSRGGVVISEVAERVPDRIELLIYLAAFLLKNGQRLIDVAQHAENWQALSGILRFHEGGQIALASEGIDTFFYNTTLEPLVRIAREQVVREPAASISTPVFLSSEKFGSVRRMYIECALDQAIPIETQRAMQVALPVAGIASLDSDHSPFFSQPRELVAAFERLRLAI